MNAWSVLIVEDEPMARRRLARAIEQHPNLTLLAAVDTCAEARAALAVALPQVLLVDIGLPDGDGIELIQEVTVRGDAVDVMVITVFGDEKHVLAALKAGATGYLLKDSAMEDIGAAVMQLVHGGSPISPPIARYLLKRFRPSERDEKANTEAVPTHREREVLKLIVAKAVELGHVDLFRRGGHGDCSARAHRAGPVLVAHAHLPELPG